MASALATAQVTILSQIDTIWGTTSPIAWPNVDFAPPVDPVGDWLRVTTLWGDAFPLTLGLTGAGKNQLVGVLELSVFVPRGGGEATLYSRVDAARDMVNRLEVSGVRFGPASGPIPVSGDPQWQQVAIRTPFRVDETI